ncbi:MAG: response regulator [Balneolaceae bacterium]|nr:response regulator [Balneolaceae bacterium]MCH8548242.1 response regulator [Balneolaceae bacterium]
MDDSKIIRLLIADDSKDDIDLILLRLRKGGYETDFLHVETADEMRTALWSREWDLIICDYSMPDFDGLSALKIAKEYNQDIPFILISGNIGEELAVKAMKSGANDYLMKDNLQRLVPAVERELKEAEERTMRREAIKERNKLQAVIQESLNEIYLFDATTLRFSYINSAALQNLGFTQDEMLEKRTTDIKPGLSQQEFNEMASPLKSGHREKIVYETEHERKDGSKYPIKIHLQLIEQDDEQYYTAIGFDQTDREKDARQIRIQKERAEEHALSSRYKSEFLANMSHELRTPLNSIILLSKLLTEKGRENLTTEQVEYINVIHNSGNGLLELINEVLDLSKIEAGEMEFTLEPVDLNHLFRDLKGLFKPIADEKGLELILKKKNSAPTRLLSDKLRIEQILKNLLSNAFKFTEKGKVEIYLYRPNRRELKAASLSGEDYAAIRVKDTGVGIPEEKRELIFESFRQADGSTQRQYGGTGLGLTISRELSNILGGEITLQSEEGIGSTFTVFIPTDSSPSLKSHNIPVAESRKVRPDRSASMEPEIPAGKRAAANLRFGVPQVEETTADRPLIIISAEDDDFAAAMEEIAASLQLEPVRAGTSQELIEYLTAGNLSALLTEDHSTGLSGWSALKAIRNRLDSESIFTALVSDYMHPLNDLGSDQYTLLNARNDIHLAGEFIRKAAKEIRLRSGTLLLVDDNDSHNQALRELAQTRVDRCLTATSAAEAIGILNSQKIDCMVLDMTLPDATGADLVKSLRQKEEFSDLPVIIYTGRAFDKNREAEILELAQDVIYKNVGSYQKLIKQICRYMKKSSADQQIGLEASLKGRDVLLADDDKQSFFSLRSVLESTGINVIGAKNGKVAVDLITNGDVEIEAVLMDVMMPVMNGLDAIKEIRKSSGFRHLPIFAVTAKAMSGDREACLRAGATDYISKPVDTGRLNRLLKIWLL